MTPIQWICVLWILAFFLGSFPTAYLAGRVFRKVDIRQYGSGNVGATNACRVLGKKIGAIVFIVDFLKGSLPVALVGVILARSPMDLDEMGLWVGVGAILGHVFTPFLNFKGGKGIATGAGVLCGAYPILFLIVLASWIAVFMASRIVSISSIASLVVLVLASILFKLKISVVCSFIFITLFIIWTHRSNISRLIQGKENKIN